MKHNDHEHPVKRGLSRIEFTHSTFLVLSTKRWNYNHDGSFQPTVQTPIVIFQFPSEHPTSFSLWHFLRWSAPALGEANLTTSRTLNSSTIQHRSAYTPMGCTVFFPHGDSVLCPNISSYNMTSFFLGMLIFSDVCPGKRNANPKKWRCKPMETSIWRWYLVSRLMQTESYHSHMPIWNKSVQSLSYTPNRADLPWSFLCLAVSIPQNTIYLDDWNHLLDSQRHCPQGDPASEV